MVKVFDIAEVASHNTSESCWVALYGDVWDVTNFLSKHPGGSEIILKMAGRDATEEYDSIHPPGTLEENLTPVCKLGRIATSVSSSTDIFPKKDEEVPEQTPTMQNLLNLQEIEDLATKRISKKTWAYYYSASDDHITKDLNSIVYKSIFLRPSVFVDCTKCSLRTRLLGYEVGTPLFVSPGAMARLAHPSGEQGIAQGVSSFQAIQIISNNASMTPEQIVKGSLPGQIFGWQLYVQNDRRKSEKWIERINKMSDKYKFIVLTLDAPVPGKRELDERFNLVEPPLSSMPPLVSKENFSGPIKSIKTVKGGLGRKIFEGTASDLSWSKTLSWLSKHTSLPIILKGVQIHEDAYLASQYFPQVRAIILSNHGGRAADTTSPPVHTLLEIRKYCPEVFDRIEIWVDGGIKRGTDVVKALCLGARAVGLGRAALYGLGAGGKEGVQRTFEILHAEIETCMRLLGVKEISNLGSKHINAKMVERNIYDGPANLETRGLWTSSKI